MACRVSRKKLFSTVLWAVFISGIASIVTRPVNTVTEVKVGDSTYLNCSNPDASAEVSWYHYPVGDGTKQVRHRYVYFSSRILNPYDKRFTIETDASAGSFNLVINQAELQDAGEYVCQEGHTDISTRAQLIVLETDPICTSNINLNGFIGPNGCGLKQDIIELSCDINYRGNVAPQLRMTIVNDKDSFTIESIDDLELNCSPANPTDHIRCSYNSTSNIKLDGSQFICYTNRSIKKQYKCSTDAVRIYYAFGNKGLIEKVVGDSLICSAMASSVDCVYTWIWVNGSHEETISQSNDLKITRAGRHRCEAKCNIKDHECRFDAMAVIASTSTAVSKGDSKIGTIIVWCGGIVLLFSVAANAAVLFLYCKRKENFRAKRRWSLKDDDQREKEPLLSNNRKEPVKMNEAFVKENLSFINESETIKTIHTKPGSLVSGITVLMKKLYVLHEYHSTIDVYDLTTFAYQKNISIERSSTTIEPLDITSSESDECLYVAYLLGGQPPCNIKCLDVSGKSVSKWVINGGECRLSAYRSNVIVCMTDRDHVVEYSPQGDKVFTFTLSPNSGFDKLWHAIKIDETKYAVSHKVPESYEHRLSIVEKDGQDTVKTMYSTTSQICGLNVPICLGQGSRDRILVADKLNNRVLAILYEADMCQKVIRDGRLKNLRSHCYMDDHPVRLCLNESKDWLFVALGGSNLKTGVICIFKEQEANGVISQETNEQSNSVEPDDAEDRPHNIERRSSESHSYKKELERIKATDTRVNAVISGITVLSGKLYVVYEYCSTIDVYDHDTMDCDPKSSIYLKNYLTNPLDIASSESSKCLYVVDLPNHKSHCRIKSVNVDGEVLNHWFVEDNECRLSVYESNVIACLPNKHQIIDYWKQGEVYRKITLLPSEGFDKLWHAIKVTETEYAVSHSVPQNYEHRVTIAETHGTPTIETSHFSSVRIVFSTTPKICGMNMPICLARDRKGHILVAEYLNNRVLLIDPISTDCEVILRDGRFKNVKSRCSIEHHPVRVCFDEHSDRLFIALCRSPLKTGFIVAFEVQDTESA